MTDVFQALPRTPLGNWPTPVHELPRLSQYFKRQLLIKRDDLSGLALGGNKTRKLEFLIGDAVRLGADTVVTGGAPQSNHCRQTAAAAAKSGLHCILVLAGAKRSTDLGNLLLDDLLGAELVWTGNRARDDVMRECMDREAAEGHHPYLIPYGGSTPLGAAAYALAMGELAAQGVQADWILFATSSGGTQSGLTVGAAMTRQTARIYGISVDRESESLRTLVHNLTLETAQLLNVRYTAPKESILVDDRFLGAGYGRMGAPEIEAIRLFAGQEGILLDPVYTGRAAAGMLAMIRSGEIRAGQTVLFWHTGGTPALWAYADQLR